MNRRKPSKIHSQAAYWLMVKFNWDIEKIKKLPLSTFIEIQKWFEWEQKELRKGR